jgi:hypothetical protein
VRNVHAAEVPAAAAIVAVDDVAVGKDVSKSAFLAKLAVALRCVSRGLEGVSGCATFVKYLQGARSVMGSSECKNGQAFPAWQAPCR